MAGLVVLLLVDHDLLLGNVLGLRRRDVGGLLLVCVVVCPRAPVPPALASRAVVVPAGCRLLRQRGHDAS